MVPHFLYGLTVAGLGVEPRALCLGKLPTAEPHTRDLAIFFPWGLQSPAAFQGQQRAWHRQHGHRGGGAGEGCMCGGNICAVTTTEAMRAQDRQLKPLRDALLQRQNFSLLVTPRHLHLRHSPP